MSGNGQVIHSNMLVTSTPDDISLCQAVEDKFKDLCNIHPKMTGVHLQIPKRLEKYMINWRTMAIRFKNGDFRHTDIEKKSLRTIAEWTLRVNARLRNQEIPIVRWRD